MKKISHNLLLTLLALISIVLCIAVLWFVNWTVNKLSKEEQNKMELWAKATKLIAKQSYSENETTDLLLQIIQSNTTIPIIVTNKNDSILLIRNCSVDQHEIPTLLSTFRSDGHCINIPISENEEQHLYFAESNTIKQLSYLPLIEIAVVVLLGLFAYLVFNQIKRADQDKVWIGLARETAHQLGTPITALSGWTDLLRSGDIDTQTAANEIDNDINRLKSIATRFSKIGSQPELKTSSLNNTINNVISYLQSRLPNNITIRTNLIDDICINHNPILLGWTIENLCKNSADAISGSGEIVISTYYKKNNAIIDVTDNGKGMSQSTIRKIFRTGFTTKQRGWGIGLALSKRIICEYHKGKIFVASSEIGEGTTIRIILPQKTCTE